MANIALSDARCGVYVVDNEYSVHRHSKKVQFLVDTRSHEWNDHVLEFFSSFLRPMIHLLFTPIGSNRIFFLVITLGQGKCVKNNVRHNMVQGKEIVNVSRSM